MPPEGAVEADEAAGLRRSRLARGRRPVASLAAAAALLAAAGGRGARAAPVRHPPFESLDEDGNGVVDSVEFMQGIQNSLDEADKDDKDLRAKVYRYTLSLYETSDLDEDGVLSQIEVDFSDWLTSSVYHSLGGRGVTALDRITDHNFREFTPDDINHILSKVDWNNDGVVDFDESFQAARDDMLNWGWPTDFFEDPRSREWYGAIFHRADMSGDGVLQGKEATFAGFLLFAKAVDVMAINLLNDFDRDQDGRIDRIEMAESLNAIAAQVGDDDRTFSISQQLWEDFEEADSDKDGVLTTAEVVYLAKQVIYSPNHF